MQVKVQSIYSLFRKPRLFILIFLAVFILFSGIATVIGFEYYRDEINKAISSNKSTAELVARILLEHQKATIGILEPLYFHTPHCF